MQSNKETKRQDTKRSERQTGETDSRENERLNVSRPQPVWAKKPRKPTGPAQAKEPKLHHRDIKTAPWPLA